MINILTVHAFGEIKWNSIFYQDNSFLALLQGIAIFHIFAKMEIKNEKRKKLIAYFTPAVFGVYLLHLSYGFLEYLIPMFELINQYNLIL